MTEPWLDVESRAKATKKYYELRDGMEALQEYLENLDCDHLGEVQVHRPDKAMILGLVGMIRNDAAAIQTHLIAWLKGV